jgi:hypothetical protein
VDEFLGRLVPSQWVLFLIATVLLTALAELGFRLGLPLHAAHDESRRSQISGLQGALLGLLGLLLGFTFAMAVARYDARRDLVVKEANAIGTTFLRADLLPDAQQAPVQDLLRRYVDVRLRYQPLSADPVMLAEGLRMSADIQNQLWHQATSAARTAPSPLVATFITALNETIDTDAERVAASRNRIPSAVWLLLLIVASLGCLLSSYAAGAYGTRTAFSSLVLPLLIAVVMTLIFDLANPHKGMIGVSQQPLVDLQLAIRASPT